jgi:hypothetical protein
MEGFSLDDILYPENPEKAICVSFYEEFIPILDKKKKEYS